MPRAVPDPRTAAFRVAVGRRLREAREAAGMTQEALGLAAGIERSFYAKVEGGQHGVLVDRLFGIAEALGVEPAALLMPPGSPLR